MILNYEINAKERPVTGNVIIYSRSSTFEQPKSIVFHNFLNECDTNTLLFVYRYECPAGCIDSRGKVVGTVHYEMVSATETDIIHLCPLNSNGKLNEYNFV